MLEIQIPKKEWLKDDEEFIYLKPCTLRLEHSLISISKWESKWKKPFMDKNSNLTPEQIIDYIRCMTLTQNVDPNVYQALSRDNINTIRKYMEDVPTATWFGTNRGRTNAKTPTSRGGKRVVTAEVIYYLMFSHGIPIECERWHINRLLTLIRVFDEETKPRKPMSKSELAARNYALNQERRARLKTRG